MTDDQPKPPEGDIGRRAARGAVALGVRQAVVMGLNFAGTVVLARLLEPAEFGIYALILLAMMALRTFGDVGLAASLVRQPEEPTIRDLRAVFAAQQSILLVAVVACWALSSVLVNIYDLRETYAWLFRMVGLALLITSFGTISMIRLERRLDFGRVGIVDTARALAFNATAIALAASGAGAFSFGAAVVVDATVGTVLLLILSPWPFGWADPRRGVRERLRFGIPYQGIGVVSLVKDSVNPIFVGMLISTAAVGYVRWAQTVANYALFALQVLQRLYMPTFARLQHDRERLGRAVEATITATNVVVAPLALVMLVLAEPITVLVYGEKWLPALDVFYALWVANLFVPIATPLLALLSAEGRADYAFGYALMWMLSTWVLSIPLILAFGAVGYGLANLGVQFTNLVLFRQIRRRLPVRILPALRPWLSALPAAGAVLALRAVVPADDLFVLGVYVALFFLLYAGLLWTFERPYLRRVAELLGVRVPRRLRMAAA